MKPLPASVRRTLLRLAREEIGDQQTRLEFAALARLRLRSSRARLSGREAKLVRLLLGGHNRPPNRDLVLRLHRRFIELESVAQQQESLGRACSQLAAAEGAFGLLELLLPARLRKEEVADAREVVARLVKCESPWWMVLVKITSTCFWAGINAVRELTSTFLHKSPGR